MPERTRHKSTRAPVLLVGILLTLVAVVAHRFLPQRRLMIDPANESAFMLVATSNGAAAEERWIDKRHFHYSCQFPQASAYQGCGFAYMLAPGVVPDVGIDLSGFHTLNLEIRYTGHAQYVRVAIRNYDPRFSRVDDTNSPKFHYVNIPTKDLARLTPISMSEFNVAEWWITAYNLPREYSHPDLTNATVLYVDLQGQVDLAGTQHEIQVDKLEFVGDWISAETWYLGILCLWMLIGTTYGTSHWLLMRRKDREQQEKINDLESEKDLYQRLSTLDGLTGVLNRYGIGQFIAGLGSTQVSASVIIVDIDHFKRVNDERGHHVGDRVLRTMGEILRSCTRNTDGLGRWGGEEFVLVCPGTSLANAADLAEKLRHKIMQTNFVPENPLPITASFGVATAKDDQGFDEAFRQADEALYLAKSRNRNCVVCSNDDQMRKITGASKGALAVITGRFKVLK